MRATFQTSQLLPVTLITACHSPGGTILSSMAFPVNRQRRLRRTEALRSFVRETRLTPAGFVYPLFICPGEGVRKPVGSMPGVFNLSVDEAVKECREVHSLGIPAVILFGLPETKDEAATGAWAEDGIVQRAARAIKAAVPNLLIMGDVCLCEYMSHGHCGIVKKVNGPTPETEYEIVNDASLDLLAKTAVSQANAGIDIIAPSDMMDGRIEALRTALDAHGFENTPIMSYAAKFASGFYGPFREAADSAPPSATAAATRWTRPMPAKPCAKSSSTCRRAPT